MEGDHETIYISSRKSHLALVQTYEVKTMLENANPGVKFEVGLSDTIGDQVQDKHLRDIGISAQGGLFTKSLEVNTTRYV